MVFQDVPGASPLFTDRLSQAGLSEGLDNRGRVHVKVANKPSEPIPVVVNVSSPGFATLSPGMPAQIPVTTSSTLLIPANTGRLFAWVSNNSNQTIYVQLGAPAIGLAGLRLCPGAKLFVSGSDLWLGDIFGITTAGSVSIDVTEMTA